jgi:hypothetical protein
MRNFARYSAMALTVIAACQAGLALAEDFYWASDTKAASSAGAETAAMPTQSTCAACGQACGLGGACPSCGDPGAALGCDACPGRGIVAFAGLDSFKGISDSFLPSNFGALAGLNAAVPVPGLSDYGIGWQLGMSYGVYDFDGRLSFKTPDQSQEQVFVTTGFFHKAEGDRRLSFGLVYDWMINNNWGILGTGPTLGQWRGQIEYALSGSNALGVWGCLRDRGSNQIADSVLFGPVDARTRAINQVNLFWHHKFDAGADSYLWVGIPDRGRLNDDGSLGDWTIGANVQVPLSDSLALYANGSYFRPSGSAGPIAAIEAGYDVSMGVVWYFGRHAVSHSINGACWLPYMPMANNSNFLVDQSLTQIRQPD